EVIAQPEKLLHVEGAALAKIAYLLGNGHVPVQFGDGFMRLAEVPDLEDALRHNGLAVTKLEAPFEPEAMGHAHHDHDDHGHDHDHDHDHGHHHH
ncbi:MAG TPA: urease accessory protein UreE, partial [Burkholderiales bacterium]|nr:urease accessory protein UreE [Burkholderiales bacterium]